MLTYIVRRVMYMIPTLVAISVVTFVIIQLPPGDYLTTVVAQMSAEGATIDDATLEALKQRYGLGEPVYTQYWKWITGRSFYGAISDNRSSTVSPSAPSYGAVWD